MTFLSRLGVALALLFSPVGAYALTPELVVQGKKATALVEIPLQRNHSAFGTAFCIDAAGIFVTNAHVASAAQGGKIHLILSPGEADERVVEATVLRMDAEMDLALLQAVNAPAIKPLELGQASSLFDTMDLVAFGYPFGGAMSVGGKGYPSISVNTGHLTSMRKKAGVLELIQLDAVLNPGNSGGPVLDSAGHVVGIVQGGLPGAGINFAIPVSRLQAFMLVPLMTVLAPAIAYERRHDACQMTVTVVSAIKPAPSYSVELTLGAGTANPRTFTGDVTGGTCSMSIVPVQGGDGKSVLVTAHFSSGMVTGRLANCTIKVGEQSVPLTTVRRISRSSATVAVATVALASGKELSGPVRGLESATISLGPLVMATDLNKALSIFLPDEDQPVASVGYKILLKAKGATVSERNGILEFAGAPAGAIAAAVPAPPAPVEGDPVTASDTAPADPRARRDPGTAPTDPRAPAGEAPAASAPDGRAAGVQGVVRTEIIGWHHDREPWVSQSPTGQDVVGFRFVVGTWANKPIIQTLEPLYERVAPAGDVCIAKPGYVVGGIMVDADTQEHAVRVIFCKEQDGKIDPKDRYLSEWISRPASGHAPIVLGGHGEHVIGLWGYRGLNLDGVGLILRKP